MTMPRSDLSPRLVSSDPPRSRALRRFAALRLNPLDERRDRQWGGVGAARPSERLLPDCVAAAGVRRGLCERGHSPAGTNR